MKSKEKAKAYVEENVMHHDEHVGHLDQGGAHPEVSVRHNDVEGCQVQTDFCGSELNDDRTLSRCQLDRRLFPDFGMMRLKAVSGVVRCQEVRGQSCLNGRKKVSAWC